MSLVFVNRQKPYMNVPNASDLSLSDSDLGFICRVCGEFSAEKAVQEWDTKWIEDPEGEQTLVEITRRCPRCDAVAGYRPNEGTLRGLARNMKPGE
jgi:hypothetical protein